MDKNTIPGLEDQDPAQLPLPGVGSPENDKLGTIIRLSAALCETEAEIEKQEQLLKDLKQKAENIGTRMLPDTMRSVGLTEISLRSGKRIVIRPEYYANISKARADDAYRWLESNNHGALIKKSLEVGVSEEEKLRELGVAFSLNQSVHAGTLKAFVKERIEAEDPNFPRELFGVHVIEKAAVK